ncbi:hypothetical protein AB0392_26865 [Nonomuraea angiospora]|uniref:hypothetical protein n=1 Tax=Nonomuraea angiospora TaxID=46172 RepID=UPI00344D5501
MSSSGPEHLDPAGPRGGSAGRPIAGRKVSGHPRRPVEPQVLEALRLSPAGATVATVLRALAGLTALTPDRQIWWASVKAAETRAYPA